MSKYQPFFEAFVNAHGDQGPHIGVEFMLWIGQQWRAYFVETGRPEMSRTTEDDYPRFAAWLTEKYPTPIAAKSAVEELKIASPAPEQDHPTLIAAISLNGEPRCVVVRFPNPEPITSIVPRVMAELEDATR